MAWIGISNYRLTNRMLVEKVKNILLFFTVDILSALQLYHSRLQSQCYFVHIQFFIQAINQKIQ